MTIKARHDKESYLPNPGIPFVAAIGGFRQLDPTAAAAAQAAGEAIGAELAMAGFGLVVYFSDKDSLEPYVVKGYAKAVKNGAGLIRVRYAESQRGQIRFDEQVTRPELFEPPDLFPGQDWEAPFYRSLAEEEGVDAVLLVAGATSTLIAGQIAMARRLPTLAVDEFGGAAGTVWNQLAQRDPGKHPSWGTRPPSALVAQLKADVLDVAARRAAARRRDQFYASITAQRYQAAYASGAFVLLLVALIFGMVYTPVVAAYPVVLFAGLIMAGATGALVRLVLWGPHENDPRASLLFGGVAGFVVGLAYLIPQWVGAPGVLTPKADIVSATDKIQFASAVLVAISAGVGFDTVFSRLRKQAQDAAVGPSR
jgi:hypothetical protein